MTTHELTIELCATRRTSSPTHSNGFDMPRDNHVRRRFSVSTSTSTVTRNRFHTGPTPKLLDSERRTSALKPHTQLDHLRPDSHGAQQSRTLNCHSITHASTWTAAVEVHRHIVGRPHCRDSAITWRRRPASK
jgi:hypothetical protein